MKFHFVIKVSNLEIAPKFVIYLFFFLDDLKFSQIYISISVNAEKSELFFDSAARSIGITIIEADYAERAFPSIYL